MYSQPTSLGIYGKVNITFASEQRGIIFKSKMKQDETNSDFKIYPILNFKSFLVTLRTDI